MKITLLFLTKYDNISSVSEYIEISRERFQVLNELSLLSDFSFSVVQRAAISGTFTEQNISFYLISDEFNTSLRWWQEPVSVFEKVAVLEPNIIQLEGLDKPLNFRWLRRMVGDEVKIVGCHNGEDIWAQRNLWLQQFGLRVADGFIFQKKSETEAWIRAAVILPRQPLFILNAYGSPDQNEAEKLMHIYKELLN